MSMNEVRLVSEQRERLLRDIWISHDGQWVLKAVQEFGFDAANKLNHAVIRSLGKIEIRRLMAVAKWGEIKNSEDFKRLLDIACGLYMPEEHHYEIKRLDDSSVLGHVLECYVFKVLECYVFKNVSKAGVTNYYRCAAKPRFIGWLEGSGLQGEVIAEKNTDNCNGTCEIIIKIKW
jgi:hypothetical protein